MEVSLGQLEKDHLGVALSDNATSIDCKDSLLRSESEKQHIVGLGLENIVAVAMPDAVLVTYKSRVQDVKEAVCMLKSENILQAETFPKDHRPWDGLKFLSHQAIFRLSVFALSLVEF